MAITKVSHNTNVWFANEKPSLVERLLAKIFLVRLIPQKCNMCTECGSCYYCKGSGKLLYLRRFYLSPRWKWLPFKLFLHHILLSDTDSALHDHPFSFRTTILKGRYTEHWLAKGIYGDMDWTSESRPGDSNYYNAEHTHRLVIIKPVWSFVIAGKATREWGFHTADGWKIWHDFLGLTSYNVYPEDEI